MIVYFTLKKTFCTDLQKYTIAFFAVFTTIKTTAVYSFTCLVDAVFTAWILAIFSIRKSTF